MFDTLIEGVTGRVRNPDQKLVRACERFEKFPREAGKTLARLGRQEGYDFIQAQVHGLIAISKSPEARKVARCLAEPEWEFRKTDNKYMLVFGLGGETFETLGTYCCAPDKEDMSVTLFADTSHLTILDEVVVEPHKHYVPCNIKQKVWKRFPGKFYVVNVSKDIEALLCYYAKEKIKKCPNYSLMRHYSHYVVESGPFKTAGEAKTARLTVID